MTLKNKKILLVIGGGISAYKALDLVRLLKKKSADIDQIVRFMIQTFAENKILCNLSVFINKSHSKKDLTKFAKIFDQIC